MYGMVTMSPIIRIVRPSGALIAEKARSLRETVNCLLMDTADIIVVDLQNVDFVDSSGLGALVSVLKQSSAQGKDLYLCSLSEQAKILFELTSLDKAFRIFTNYDAFCNAILSRDSQTQNTQPYSTQTQDSQIQAPQPQGTQTPQPYGTQSSRTSGLSWARRDTASSARSSRQQQLQVGAIAWKAESIDHSLDISPLGW